MVDSLSGTWGPPRDHGQLGAVRQAWGPSPPLAPGRLACLGLRLPHSGTGPSEELYTGLWSSRVWVGTGALAAKGHMSPSYDPLRICMGLNPNMDAGP